jgi:hypothetical protein
VSASLIGIRANRRSAMQGIHDGKKWSMGTLLPNPW